MRIVRTTKELQQQANQWRSNGLTIGLVPTMGFFHEGHLSLMREARRKCDRVITTLFVNPMQFGPNEDLDSYPRSFERDQQMAEGEGVDLLFCPDPSEMYGEQFQTKISLDKVSQGLCGADRPGHFDGVATVVTKLFNLAKPHKAVFGQKDFQQLALIRQLVADLNFDIEIIGHPIVREEDGLAMSSRNKYLDANERKIAVCLSQAIGQAKKMLADAGGSLPAQEIITMAESMIEQHPECSVEYVSIVHQSTLRPMEIADGESVLAMAMKVNNKVRLIDNSPLC
ncbi:pantoate--beta-alanine ligase [Desulfosediminicola ganghwensis]|uniref:pantoate--beta-alanine ligase n=1 Tax=Desulfosediminicola ganghwensis TaxID=2569540 RepID=UPI0010AD112F|nr:pantoate--beta-alanine ligase [Desulfosediminicola ganghwensis]